MTKRDEIIKEQLLKLVADFKDVSKPAPQIDALLYFIFDALIAEVRKWLDDDMHTFQASNGDYNTKPEWLHNFLDSLSGGKK